MIIRIKKVIKANLKEKETLKATEEQFRTLVALKEEDEVYLKDLSTKTGVSTSSLCIMLNKLCEEGLVDRKTDINDRRNTMYFLTNEGKEVFDKEKESRMLAMIELLNHLNSAEREAFYHHIQNVNKILEKLIIRT
jgi:DNA-binding MarR family transcriptional regulator